MNYYLSKYIGKYRIKAEIDQNTNDFCRDISGQLDNNSDIYISCQNDIRVYHYGGNTLEAYVPSKGRAHNIIKGINEKYGKDILFDIVETDGEVYFKFKDKHLENVFEFIQPRVNGADITPFSPKNLPKKKDVLSKEQLEEYNATIKKIKKEDFLIIRQLNKRFLDEKVPKKLSVNLKDELKKEQLRLRDWFYVRGYEKQYIEFLTKEIENIYG